MAHRLKNQQRAKRLEKAGAYVISRIHALADLQQSSRVNGGRFKLKRGRRGRAGRPWTCHHRQQGYETASIDRGTIGGTTATDIQPTKQCRRRAPRHARRKNPIQSYGVKDCSLHAAISNATTARLLLKKAGVRGAPELLSRASTAT
jgi:hypothetical protein